MKSFRTYLFLGILMAAFGWQCFRSSPSITRQNFASYYQKPEEILQPKFVLFNETDSLVRLFFSINSKQLLYEKGYIVRPAENGKIITDSGHVVMSDIGQPSEEKILASFVDMDVINSGNYAVEVSFRDVNKMTVSQQLLYLIHGIKNGHNNFLVTSAETSTPLFRTNILPEDSFQLTYTDKSIRKILVRYYKNGTGPAPPPYAMDRPTQKIVADSSWWIDLDKDKKIAYRNEGIYRFSLDTSASGGYCLSRFHLGFPEITVAKQLLYPLRYLVTKTEYNEMDTAVNTKKAVDKFWLSCTGNEERAREVIRSFYNRVGATNTLFSTEKEGWKTDRGMIYLIFGPPDNVFRNVNYETWMYSPDMGAGNVVFTFRHSGNALTDQEFILERNTEYKINWIQAVDYWRQGHVYSLH
jgi:GWxTD domain-containing protein